MLEDHLNYWRFFFLLIFYDWSAIRHHFRNKLFDAQFQMSMILNDTINLIHKWTKILLITTMTAFKLEEVLIGHFLYLNQRHSNWSAMSQIT